ncbi:MAG: hypothetical protein GY838_08405 [bacterium]|nr:hypothetical protein [bacterium]
MAFTHLRRRARMALPCFFSLLIPALAAAATGAPVIGVDEIRPGMTGYGLTVFAGARIDTFGVVVVGVQENIRADGHMILVEVSGHGLEKSSIAQGMSGSPVFLDGRLAGALAFGWGGALRPLGGVTPAAELLAVSTAVPAAAELAVTAPETDWAPLTTATGGELARTLGLGAGLPSAEPAWPRGWPEPADLAVHLLTPYTDDDHPAAWVCRPAGQAAAAGSASGVPRTLAPGAACAVPLVMGDAKLGAIGTVTWVDGDDVHMMGHPFMQRGGVRWPLATADIVTLFPSRQISFKMGSIGEVVGAVHQDRRAGIAGRLGAEAPLLPVHVKTPHGSYDFQVANDRQLAPALVFWAFYNSLLAVGDDASLQTVHWSLRADWHADGEIGSRTLNLAGATAGPGGVASLGNAMTAPLRILLGNPFAPVQLERVEVELRTEPGVATAEVRGLSALATIAAGTRSLPVEVALAPRHGVVERRTIELPLPADLAPGRHRLVVASSAEFFALEAQRAPARFRTGNLNATVDLLETERGLGTLVVALLARGRAVVVGGNELAGLPGSLARTVRRSVGSEQKTAADFVARHDESTPWLLLGHAVLDVRVTAAAGTLEPERRP